MTPDRWKKQRRWNLEDFTNVLTQAREERQGETKNTHLSGCITTNMVVYNSFLLGILLLFSLKKQTQKDVVLG